MSHYFVRVEDAKDVRRQLLESSKMCIHTIKQEHRMAEIRRHKLAVIQHISNELKELTFLLGSLEKLLPVMTKKELLEINPGAYRKPALLLPEVKKSKFDKLEESLSMIEDRLDKL